MEIKESYEVIIVGGGPSGLAAGLYCQRAGLKTILFEKGLIGGQIAVSKEIENYPGVEGITGFELAERLVNHARTFGLRIVQEEVADIRAGQETHSVRLANGDWYDTHALILAAGGSVRKLGVPGEAEYLGRGVSYCATCDGFFFREKTVVVVGGGETAAEEALYLSRLVRKVFLIHRNNSLRAGGLLQNRILSEPKIEMILNTALTAIKGSRGIVEAVSYENAESGEKGELRADGVFIFIGYAPNSMIIPAEIVKDELGFVRTDEKCETNIPGIFAVGDLRKKFANQIVIAAADGAMAGLAAAHYVETKKTGVFSC